MNKVGFFGTCRVKIINSQDDFKKIKFDDLPYIYKNNNIQINIRPLGYTTTTSDIYQNLSLIHSKFYKKINNTFLFNNIFLKRGGKSIITDLDYDCIVLEICSIKKLIHLKSNLVIPYEVEGEFIPSEYITKSECYNETIENIQKIQKLLNCKIILLPPITEISGYIQIGKHENTFPNKVLEYRKEIIARLIKASDNKNIFLFNWNKIINEKGENFIMQDQFHFTNEGKKYIGEKLIDFITKTI
jgi:hypothetical protein